MRRTDSGFTLVELVIVLCIISAMVTVAIPYATRSAGSSTICSR